MHASGGKPATGAPAWRLPACVLLAVGVVTLLSRAGRGRHQALVAGGPGSDDWLVQLHSFSDLKVGFRSQGAQDVYLFSIFNKVGTTNKRFVEFGFNSLSYEVGTGANTRFLFDHGWRGLLLDADNVNATINLHAHFLYRNNIADLFQKYRVPQQLDFLSVDMDSHDLWVFDSILAAGYRPRVITTEFNSNYPLDLAITQMDPTLTTPGGGTQNDETAEFVFRGCAWGASAAALRMVADKFGYSLVGRISLLDLVWLRNDLVDPSWRVPEFAWFFAGWPTLGKLHHEKQASPEVFDVLLDWGEYEASGGDLRAAKAAARRKLREARLPCFEGVA